MGACQLAFEEAVLSITLDKIPKPDTLKTLALAFWHEGFIPSIQEYPPSQQQAAGFLIDSLSKYNCIPVAQREKLGTLARRLRAELVEAGVLDASLEEGTTFAQRWQVKVKLTRAMQPLLQYQTRHYKHVTGQAPE